jgi:hypothetical protein
MKSFSDNLPNKEKLVTAEEFESFKNDLTGVIKSIRVWMFGLATTNLLTAIVLFVSVLLHH